MNNIEYLEQKRLEVLKEIKPICEAFGIKDYDYELHNEGQTEILRIERTTIGCTWNSISAVVDELIGYIFIRIWCKNRCLGAFENQAKSVIKQHWISRGD